VQLQVDPEANGVRVLMIVEPAVWFGIFEFPGAERFPYSKLVQIANYRGHFNKGKLMYANDMPAKNPKVFPSPRIAQNRIMP
jgi:hypothetical protein